VKIKLYLYIAKINYYGNSSWRYHQLILMSSVPITSYANHRILFDYFAHAVRLTKSIYSFFNLLSHYISSIFLWLGIIGFFYINYIFISVCLSLLCSRSFCAELSIIAKDHHHCFTMKLVLFTLQNKFKFKIKFKLKFFLLKKNNICMILMCPGCDLNYSHGIE